MAHYLTTIDPKQFIFFGNLRHLADCGVGRVGSITGSVVAAIVVTIAMEALRFLDGPLNLGFMMTNGVPGLRMVFFSALLMVVVIYRQQGLMGKSEFNLGCTVTNRSSAAPWYWIPERGKVMGSLLKTVEVNKLFGGLAAVTALNGRRAGRDRRTDRPEWCWQNDFFQSNHREPVMTNHGKHSV